MNVSKATALALLTFVSLLAACGADPPKVALTISDEMTPPFSQLVRLRLIVRVCGQPRFAIDENLSMLQEARTIDAALMPGDRFYVWLQGWGACDQNAMNVPCISIPEESPSKQQMTEEYCTSPTRAYEGKTEVAATLGPVTGQCPPRCDASG